MTSAESSIDKYALAIWLDRHVPELGDGPLNVVPLAGGATNIVATIDRGGLCMVLRRPPAIPRADSVRTLAREIRVQQSLNDTDVPAPALIASCVDPDVIGVPFYIMEMVEGWSVGPRNPLPERFASYEQRRKLAFALVDGIASLARVNYQAVGLEDFGRPDNFLARQVNRWLAHRASYAESESYALRAMPGINDVSAWLGAHLPPGGPAAILHGDYGFANVLFAYDQSPRLAGIIDWELSTIGDPLLDLGWLLYGFKGETDEGDPPSLFFHPDYPSREELADRYAAAVGRPLHALHYYVILAQFKLALLLERHYARGLNGRLPREKGDRLGQLALALMQRAAEMAHRHSHPGVSK